MPFGGLLSLGISGISAASSLSGLLGGTPSQNVQLPQTYGYANQRGADANAYGGIGNLGNYNVAAQYLPQYQQIAQNSISNPYAGGYQSGAVTAGQLGQGAGANAYGAGGALQGSALSTLPDVNALLSLGFDPQNALYAKMQQQNTDQTNARLAQSGVATTPYGAGLADQSNQNFNLGWQNNLLQRATQGASGAGGLLGAAGTGLNTGAALQSGGANTYLQGSGAPYSTMQGIDANALQTLSGAAGYGTTAGAGQQQQIQDYLNYLSGGTAQQGANTGVANTALTQGNQTFNQQQQLGGQLGSSLAGLSKAWGNTGWGASGGFGSTPTSSAGAIY